jgi:ArsR family transcriptional regulator
MPRTSDPEALLLHAAGDPVRLSILRQLAVVGEVCACDFDAMRDVSQPTVSHHLKVLREAGWIRGERRGTWIWYSLRPEAVDLLRGFTETFDPRSAAIRSSHPTTRDLPVIDPGSVTIRPSS